MDLEGIMLSEINQTKTNTICYHLYVESKIRKQTGEYSNKEIELQRANQWGNVNGKGKIGVED